MNYVEPIRSIEDIKNIEMFLKASRYGERDFLIFSIGINIGLRISDILKLKVSDIKNKDKITIREQKTSKLKTFPINEKIRNNIVKFIEQFNLSDNDYLFFSQKTLGNKPIDRINFYRRLNSASKKAGIKTNIGTHSMRKTFGYHFYKQTKDLTMLQRIFNHSNSSTTLRYIGITQDNIDNAYKLFEFKENNQEEKNEIIERIDRLEETIITLLDYLQGIILNKRGATK